MRLRGWETTAVWDGGRVVVEVDTSGCAAGGAVVVAAVVAVDDGGATVAVTAGTGDDLVTVGWLFAPHAVNTNAPIMATVRGRQWRSELIDFLP